MAVAYRLFTAATWKNWDTTGKAEVVKTIKDLLQEDPNDPGISKPGQDKDLTRCLYEFIWAIVKGDLGRDKGKPLLSEILEWHPDIASQVVEVATVIDLETTNMDRPGRQREGLLVILKSLDLDKLLKERLEIETIGDAGIVKNKKNFHTKQIKVKTKLFYKQQKFNLVREETEGYAKLVTELNQDLSDSVTPQSMIQVIRSLIGGFNLDPNRVLDLILEGIESRPNNHKFFTDLLNLFPCESSTISELLGFKLRNYSDKPKEAKGCYSTIALLLQANILQLSDIYNWLTPDDAVMVEEHSKEEQDAKDFASKANVVSTKDKDKDKDKEREKEEEEKEKEDLRDFEQYNSNQKLQLCIALLEVGAWENFLEIAQRFPDFHVISCPPVSLALCNLIHSTIEPIYRKHCCLPERLQGSVAKPLNNVHAPAPCHSFNDMINIAFPMIMALGPHLYHDQGLTYKILRLAKAALKENKKNGDNKSPFFYEFMSILDETLLPVLSMLEANPCLAEEIWEAIKFYPYQYRYKLYGRWKNETCAQHPALIRKKISLLKKAKFIMMRVTKETIKPVSRNIGKLTHNNPGPIFSYILLQVQLYDNLIGPVVDSFKYLTSLSYDMLGYCIVEVLTENKERLANDAMMISPWLQSLSNFCGAVFKKYNVDLGGVLQFVANQLKAEKSIDLLIMREIVQKMGGTDSMEDLTPEQLSAMCGGELLRKEAGQYVQERNTKRSSQRLKDALMENDLAIPILLLMAQQRSSVVYNQTESPHLKLVGKLYDQCQDTMAQFGAYLFQLLSIDELNARLPSIGSLLSDCHINADVAFFLARPLFVHMLTSKYDELRRQDRGERKLTIEQKKTKYIEACNEVFVPIVDSIRPHFSMKVWEDMDPSFFLTFWTLTMSDLEVPHQIYEKEIKKLNDQIAHITKQPKDDMPSNKRKKETDRLTSLKEKLQEEEKRQKEHVERVHARLQQEKDKWFMLRAARSPKNDTVTAFLQLCLFPRCTFTALDAIYCARFVKMLHSQKTPNFSTLICYDRMYCDITYTVASCTEAEAHRYAKFLLGTLETVMHWHSSRDYYEKECANYPGFVTKYRVSRQEANDYVDYENYRHVVHKWHYKITKALVTCLESGDYIQIRNAILILMGIITRFPAITNLAAVIEKRIEKVKAEEKNRRNDLYVLANSYSGRLKTTKAGLMPETDFHNVPKKQSTKATANGTVAHSKSAKETKEAKETKDADESKGSPTKAEPMEVTNGEVDVKDEKKENGKVSKEKKDIKKEDVKKDDKKKEETTEKSRKRPKEAKKIKDDEEIEEDGAGGEQRESSVASNASSASNKLEPPQDGEEVTRSKRRKTEVKVSI